MTTTDNLDFKHHNYKEMRQVGQEAGVCWRVGGSRLFSPVESGFHLFKTLLNSVYSMFLKHFPCFNLLEEAVQSLNLYIN